MLRPGPTAVVCKGPSPQATSSSSTALQTPHRVRSQSMELPVGGETRSRSALDVTFGSWRGPALERFSTPPKGGGQHQAATIRVPGCTGGSSSASGAMAPVSSPLGVDSEVAACRVPCGSSGAAGAAPVLSHACGLTTPLPCATDPITITRRDSIASPQSTLQGSAKFVEPGDYDPARMQRWLLGDIATRMDERGGASNQDLERALEAVQRQSLELRVEAAHMESACLEMERARVEAEKTRLEQRTLEFRVEAEETRLETGQLERRLEELRQLQELDTTTLPLSYDVGILETSGSPRGTSCDRQEGEAAAGLPRHARASSSLLGFDDQPEATSRGTTSFRRIRAVESPRQPRSGSAVVAGQPRAGSAMVPVVNAHGGATRASPPLASRCTLPWSQTSSTGSSMRFSINAPLGGSQRHCKMSSSASAVRGRATLPSRLQVPALPGSK